MPGMRLRRLANSPRGPTRQLAAVYYDNDGALAPSHTWLIDVDAATAAAHGSRAASLSVDVVPGSGHVGWTLVLEAHPHPGRAVYTDLAPDAFNELIAPDQTVVDLAT